MTEEDWSRFTIAVGKLSKLRFLSMIHQVFVLMTYDLNVKLKEHGLDMIVIDYLQLIQGSGSRFSDNRQQVSEISRTLKAIAVN